MSSKYFSAIYILFRVTLIVFAASLLTLPGKANATLLCADVLTTTPLNFGNDSFRNLIHFVNDRYSVNSALEIPAVDLQGQSAMMHVNLYRKNIRFGNQTVASVRLDRGITTANNNPAFTNFVKESIEFVLKAYSLRRDWSPEFRKQLYEQAIADSARSTYLLFYTTDPSIMNDVLRGTLKIIKASESKNEILPVDLNLGISLPYNAGLKFELGNFAIAKEFNKEAFSELLIQLMLHSKEVSDQPGHDPKKMIYFTYADSYSIRMYQGLGFTPVPGFEKPIEKNGTLWVPMGISTEGIQNIPRFMLNSRAYWEPQVLNELLDIFEKISAYSSNKLGYSAWFLENYFITIRLLSQDFKAPREISIYRPGESAVVFQSRIPAHFIPMKNNSSGYSTDRKFKLHYQDGILRVISREDEHLIFKIKVDPNFSKVESINRIE